MYDPALIGEITNSSGFFLTLRTESKERLRAVFKTNDFAFKISNYIGIARLDI